MDATFTIKSKYGILELDGVICDTPIQEGNFWIHTVKAHGKELIDKTASDIEKLRVTGGIITFTRLTS
jgi:hypothetical protein